MSNEMIKGKVAVIGAGLAGLACAQRLLDLGFSVDLFEVNNMDHSIHMGLLAANKIAGLYQGSLWNLNFDGSL